MLKFIAGVFYLLFDNSALPPHIYMTHEEWEEWRVGLFARYSAHGEYYKAVEIYQNAVDQQNRRANILTIRWVFWFGVLAACFIGWLFL